MNTCSEDLGVIGAAAGPTPPRVHAELDSVGTRCSRKRVVRFMGLVRRNFRATEVDKDWVADVTYSGIQIIACPCRRASRSPRDACW